MELIQRLTNDSNESILALESKSLKLDRFSRVIDSSFSGRNQIGDFSCVNRSEFGSGSHVGVGSYVADATLGKYVMVGSRVSIGGFQHPTDWLSMAAFQWGQSIAHYNLDHNTVNRLTQKLSKPESRRTIIGNDVWIGDNSIIKAGIKIMHGAVVGAGSVVTKNVGPYEIHVGNPARLLKLRFTKELIDDLLETKWWEFELSELSELDFSDIRACVRTLKEKRKEANKCRNK